MAKNTEEQTELVQAGFGRRLCAVLIDSAYIGLFTIWTPFLVGMVQISTESKRLAEIVGYLAVVAVGLLYYTLQWGRPEKPYSIGKRRCGISIVPTDTSPMSKERAFIRGAGYMVSGLPLLLGFLWAVWDPNKQAWHDKLAKTYVLKREDPPRWLVEALSTIVIFGGLVWFLRFIFSTMMRLFIPLLDDFKGVLG